MTTDLDSNQTCYDFCHFNRRSKIPPIQDQHEGNEIDIGMRSISITNSFFPLIFSFQNYENSQINISKNYLKTVFENRLTPIHFSAFTI